MAEAERPRRNDEHHRHRAPERRTRPARYEAFDTADMKTLTEIFDESASWHTPGRSFRAELQHVLADDEGRVVAMHHNSGTRAGKRLDVDCCIVSEIRDGRFIDGREYVFDLHAWDEFWS